MRSVSSSRIALSSAPLQRLGLRTVSTHSAQLIDMSKTRPLAGGDVISAKQFDKSSIEYVFKVAAGLKKEVERNGGVDLLKHRVLANVFMEPSTRTASSFHAAMLRLGGAVVPINELTSSAQKGETLEDTVRTMENYADVLVLRHPKVGSAATAAHYARIPVINAGDGQGEHPTQALLDLFLIHQERGSIDGASITLLGDLKYGRTVHSLSVMLALFPGIKINLVSPPNLAMPAEVVAEVKAKGITVTETADLDAVLSTTDVLYQTRVQKERFASLEEYEKSKGAYIITPATLSPAKKSLLLLHPFPRVDEITPDVDQDPRAMYFKQPQYGMYMRMALLASVLGKEGPML